MKNVLVILAHHDDEVIWMHDTLLWLRESGSKITVISVFCLDRKEEFISSLNYFGVTDFRIFSVNELEEYDDNQLIMRLYGEVSIINPDLILTHSPYGNSSYHKMHRACYELSKTIGCKIRVPVAYTMLCNHDKLFVPEILKVYLLGFYDTFKGISRRGLFRSSLAMLRFFIKSNRPFKLLRMDRYVEDRVNLAKILYPSEDMSGYSEISLKSEYLVMEI
jgi:hypothetical protein